MTQTQTLAAVPDAPAATYPDHYSMDDRAMCEELAASGRSIADLSRLSGIHRATLSLCMGRRYTSAPTEHLRAAAEALRAEEDRASEVRVVPWVPGAVYRMLGLAVRRARMYRSLILFRGEVGTGKTRAARELCAGDAHLVLIEAHGEMSLGGLLDDLCTALHVQVPPWAAPGAKISALVKRLRGQPTVIIIDEAETLAGRHRGAKGARALEALRRVSDLAEVGIVLMGTPLMDDVISRDQFDQLRSRSALSPETIRGVPLEDIEAVARAAFADQAEALTDDIIRQLFRSAGGRIGKDGAVQQGGSMRVLVRGLIPGIRDFGLARGRSLSVGLVRSVARQALGLREDVA